MLSNVVSYKLDNKQVEATAMTRSRRRGKNMEVKLR